MFRRRFKRSKPRTFARRPKSFRPLGEQLEGRELLATLHVVTKLPNPQDPTRLDPGTFAWALHDANNNGNPGEIDEIRFALDGTGPFLVGVGGFLITEPVFINGASQPGYTPGRPLIELEHKPLFRNSLSVLAIHSGKSTIQGLVIRESTPASEGFVGVSISGGGDNKLLGNFIGTDATGNNSTVNPDGSGLHIGVHIRDSNGNVIGGPDIGNGNVISGIETSRNLNTHLDGIGIYLERASGTIIQGNFVGTKANGRDPLANAFGIVVANASENTFGSTRNGAGNVVSGNRGVQIRIAGVAEHNRVIGNRIGTDSTGAFGVVPPPDAPAQGVSGVVIIGQDAKFNEIGGTTARERNIISGNAHGVVIAEGASGNKLTGNHIGTDFSGMVAIPNRSGVVIQDSPGNFVGLAASTPGTAPGNVISGNVLNGVQIAGPLSQKNLVFGNLIGTNKDGDEQLLDNLSNETGVRISNGAQDNSIGGWAVGTRNIISGNIENGVVITDQGTALNKIHGNFIGTDLSGTARIKNDNGQKVVSNRIGVAIINGATANQIGGDDDDDGTADGAVRVRNVISGNMADGVRIEGAGTTLNRVAGNYIGSDADGLSQLEGDNGQITSNVVGVRIQDKAQKNFIGDSSDGAGNVISGNLTGVLISGLETATNTVQGNYIGTNKYGTARLDNDASNIFGVVIASAATANVIGGTSASERNVISGNRRDGVAIQDPATSFNKVLGNYIGPAKSGMAQLEGGESNQVGVVIANEARNNFIGGDDAEDGAGGGLVGARNVISGNSTAGVRIEGASTTLNQILGNYIGPNSDGLALLTGIAEHFLSVGVMIESAASGNTVGGTTEGARNVIAGNGTGVLIRDDETVKNRLLGNYIGTDQSGAARLIDDQITVLGVVIRDGASQNEVGGAAEADRNVISGNATGVWIDGDNTQFNQVLGNFIGTDKGGTARLRDDQSNSIGVTLTSGASLNTIGGTIDGARNIISGNTSYGVRIDGDATLANQVVGNYIGTDKDGVARLAGGRSNGVGVAISNGATFNTIGFGTEGRNVISGNLDSGVLVDKAGVQNRVSGNYIGTDKDGTQRLANAGNGVLVRSSNETIIGSQMSSGKLSGGNVISGNDSDGLSIQSSSGTKVFGNLIGTDKDNAFNIIPNCLIGPANCGFGVVMHQSSETTIGGNQSEQPNVISGNWRGGVSIRSSRDANAKLLLNTISHNADNGIEIFDSADVTIGPENHELATGQGNAINGNGDNGIQIELSERIRVNGNQVFNNDEVGLYCRNHDKVTASGTTFYNNAVQWDCPRVGTPLQVTPAVVPTAVQRGSTRVEAIVTGEPNTNYHVEFFAGPPPEDGFSDPEQFLGSVDVDTDEVGIANVLARFAAELVLGSGVMATLTGPDGNSSNFSRAVPMTEPSALDEVSIEDAMIMEGDPGAGAALEINLIRRNVSDRTITVDVNTADGTASVAGGDYAPLGGVVIAFPPGVIRQTLRIPLIGDAVSEPDETFSVMINNAGGGAVIGRSVGRATILNDDANKLRIGDATAFEGDSGTAELQFTVSLAEPINQQVTVEVNTADGSAMSADGDYVPIRGRILTFSPGGPLTQWVTVAVSGDQKLEGDEQFVVKLSNASGENVLIADPDGLLTIRNDDVSTFISIGDARAFEEGNSGTTIEFVVSLSSPSETPVTVQIDTVDNVATVDDNDYVPIRSRIVTFLPGQPLSQIVAVQLVTDTKVEPDETFWIVLSNATGLGVSIADAMGEGVIANNDDTELFIPDIATLEGTGGDRWLELFVRLTHPNTAPVTVEVNTADGTAAAADSDYMPIIGHVITFQPGEMIQRVTVNVGADATMEANEAFTVHLSNASGPHASIGDSLAVARILNDDTAAFYIEDVSIAEGNTGTTELLFTVGLTNPTDQPLSVRVDTIDGSAVASAGDYAPITGVILTFPPGESITQTVAVDITGNLLTEPDETFRLALSSLPGETITIIDDSGLGTVLNDDADADRDGVSDVQEDFGPNMGDANLDGVADRHQSNVTAIPSAIDGRSVPLISSVLTDIADAKAVVNPDPIRSPAGITFPLGFFDYSVTVPRRGESATVTLLMPPGVTADAYYQFGRQSPTDALSRYVEFPYDGTTGAEVFPDRIVVHLLDGGRGDQDLVADGKISVVQAPAKPTGADLSLQMVASSITVGQNRPLRYTLSVTNHGPRDATDVALVNQLPVGAQLLHMETSQGIASATGNAARFELGTLPSGASATAVLDVSSPIEAGVAINTATVQALQHDPESANNETSVATLVRLVGLITGQKFQDANGNAERDANEQGLNGVIIELIDDATGQVVTTTTTGPIDLNFDDVIDPLTERGRYEFEVLVGGTYVVREQVPPDFSQTYPAGNSASASTERVSVASTGIEANHTSSDPSISADGQFVAFVSSATNLVPGDTNNASDVFVFDRTTKAVERVSIPDPRVEQTQANGASFSAAISADGRYVAFVSQASNLIIGDTPCLQALPCFIDVFVHDRILRTTARVSESANGIGGNFHSGIYPEAIDQISISGDGRFVAFSSLASNLLAGPDPTPGTVYVKDRQTAAVERVPRATLRPAISADGRFVAALGGTLGMVAFDRQTRASDDIPAGTESIFESRHSPFPSINADGRFVAFASSATNLVTGDTNAAFDVFVFDRQARATRRASVDANGNQSQGGIGSFWPSISADGRQLSFVSDATNLVPGDTNARPDVFKYDLLTGDIRRVSVDNAGNQATGGSLPADFLSTAISADGRVLAYDADATDLVLNDTNSTTDVFIHAPGPADRNYRMIIVPGETLTGRDFGNLGTFTFDFGDAPDSFGTRLDSDGARHLVGGPTLGVRAEPETDGQPAENALADDLDGIDDEEGVVFTTPLVVGDVATIAATASEQTLLSAWIDFDRNGVFDRSTEQVFAGQTLSAGDNDLSFVIPSFAQSGATYARFRVSTVGELLPTGPATDGEVEDYLIHIQPTPQADLKIKKTVDLGVLAPGGRLTYTIEVSNHGPSDAREVLIRDMLPPNTTLVGGNGWAADALGTLTSELGTIAVGGTSRSTLVVDVGPDFIGQLTNVATVQAMTPEASPGDEEARVDVQIIPPADLVVSISDRQDPVVAGSSVFFPATTAEGEPTMLPLGSTIRDSIVVYTITVRNDGLSDAQDVLVTHALPSEIIPLVNIAPRSLGTIPAGTSKQYTIAGQVDFGVLGTIAVRAIAVTTTPEVNLSNNTADEDTTVIEHADLGISIMDDADPIRAGSTLTYTMTVHNQGPSDAHNVMMNVLLPTGVTLISADGCGEQLGRELSCDLGTISPGQLKRHSFEVQVDSDSAGLVFAHASASSSTAEANPGDESAIELTTVVPNHVPQAIDDSASTEEAVAVRINVLANDVDVDGDVLKIAAATQGTKGTVTIHSDGTITYAPVAGFSGTDAFTYLINDGAVNSNTASVTVTVLPVNNRPTAYDDAYAIAEDTTLSIPAAGVLTNDSDGDGDSLTAILVSHPVHGSLTLSANGSFDYHPNANYNGSDSFSYKVNDGSAVSDTATVTITVSAVDDAPLANNDAFAVAEDTTLNVGVPGVLYNDTDVDGNALTAVIVAGPAHGSLALAADGSLTYTPHANFNGSDSFHYRANDGTANSNVATVILAVSPTNDTPVAVMDTYTIEAGQTLDVVSPGLLSNDQDIDGDSLITSLLTSPTHGLLTLRPNGSFSYTPSAGFIGTDIFVYQANDGVTNSNPATVTIVVNPMNEGTPGKITGGGSVDERVRNFGFNVQTKVRNGEMSFSGSLQFHEKALGYNLHSTAITLIRIEPDGIHAMFTGTATLNTVPGYTFTAYVEDNGEPGARVDRFRLSIQGPAGFHYDSNNYASRGGLLDQGGNIQVHQAPSSSKPLTSVVKSTATAAPVSMPVLIPLPMLIMSASAHSDGASLAPALSSFSQQSVQEKPRDDDGDDWLLAIALEQLNRRTTLLAHDHSRYAVGSDCVYAEESSGYLDGEAIVCHEELATSLASIRDNAIKRKTRAL